MSGTVPPEDSGADPRANLLEIAVSIESDFQALIDNLDRHIGLLAGPNSEALTHLARAKTIADRGLRLSQRLSDGARQSVEGS